MQGIEIMFYTEALKDNPRVMFFDPKCSPLSHNPSSVKED
jgi:hypothetical protein